MSFLRNRNPMRASHSWVGGLVAFLLLSLCTGAFAADISVVTVHGDVRATQAGVNTPLYAGAVLQLPATIRTGHDGAFELRQGPTTIAAAADTELEIPVSAAEAGLIERVVQVRGNAFYNVGKRERTKLRVETPYLVAVIKGTQFNVASYEDSTTIALFEGRLEVRATDDSDVVDLHAGEIAIRNRNDVSIRVLRMSPAARAPTRTDGAVAANDLSNGQPNASDGRSASGNGGVVGGGVGGGGLVDSRPGVDASVASNQGNVVVGVGASAGNGGRGVEVGAGVGVSIDKVSTAGVNAGVDVAGASASVGGDAAVDLGSGSVSADASVGVSAGSVASADVGATAAVDLSSATVAADTSAAVDVAGTTAAVDTSVAVAPSAISADTSVAADVAGVAPASVDLGATIGTTEPSVSTEVAATTPVVDLGASVGVTPTTVEADVSVGGITVAPTVDLGSGTVDLGLGGSSDDGGLLGLGGLLKKRSTK